MRISPLLSLRHFEDMVFSADEIETMLCGVQGDHVAQQLDPHFQLLLKDAMTHTHFHIKGLDMVCQTHRGTRPGDPLGDLLFNWIFALVMQDARNSILESTPFQWIGGPDKITDLCAAPSVPPLAFMDLAFVDDYAITAHGPDIPQVQQFAKQAVHAVSQAARKRGLLLNYAAGKTEMLFNFRGRGSREAKLAVTDASGHMHWSIDDQNYSVVVTHAYKHLGSWIQTAHKHNRELAARATAVRRSWGPLHRPFYSKRYVAMQTKVTVFKSLTMSRLYYNIHILAGLSSKNLETWTNALRKPLGLLLHGRTKGVSPLELDVETLCGLLGLLPPGDALHAARLRYLGRLIRHGPATLWTLLRAAQAYPNSWLSACQQSFRWFHDHYGSNYGPPQVDDLDQWLMLVSLDPGWCGRVKRACHSCLQFRQAYAEARLWQKVFDRTLLEGGIQIPRHATAPTERWECDLCSQ